MASCSSKQELPLTVLLFQRIGVKSDRVITVLGKGSILISLHPYTSRIASAELLQIYTEFIMSRAWSTHIADQA